MNFCSKCVLPDTFPGITFNENGICNYCLHTTIADVEKRDEYLKKFEGIINNVKGKHTYDVIMAYSGGKDSTYTMHHLADKYGLKILAYTFDNGFISPKAMKNIAYMVNTIGATSIIIKPPFNIMKKIFRSAATEDFYSPKTLDRASSICTTCIGHVKSLVLKTALQMNIPMVAYGWSPGQAPITSAIMQTNPRLQRISNKTVRDPLLNRFGKDIEHYFLTEEELALPKEKWPINIHPFAFIDYNETNIIKKIESLGWEKPLDTDPNSSNCILNALANYLHRKKFYFHPYAWEIAGIVRSGCMQRNEGIEKITQEENISMVKYAADKLDIKI